MQVEGDVIRFPEERTVPLDFAAFFAEEHRGLMKAPVLRSAFVATRRGGGDAGSTYSVEPASSTGGVSGGSTLAPCSNTISPSRTSTMIVSPARNSL